MKEQTIQEITQQEAIEFDIENIINFIRTNFRRTILWGIGAAIIGFLYAFTAQKEFESRTIVLPELQSSTMGKLGNLGALASLAGVDMGSMGSNTDAVRPDLYPSITQSLPFALHILNQKVYISTEKRETTVEDFLLALSDSWLSKLWSNRKKEIALLDPKNLSGAIELNTEKELLVKEVQSRISTSFDRKTGMITITAKMPDPVAAATVAHLSVEYLKNYVTNYRTEKTRKQLSFLEKQVAEAKSRYQGAESTLAGYRDRNSFLVMNTAKIGEQRRQSEFMLAQNMYNGLVQQYEQAKIRVEEETPVFKLLEPARIPLRKSEPKRLTIILSFGILGILLGIFYGLVKITWQNYSNK